MKITYDERHDVLYIGLKSGAIAESDEHTPGTILDLDDQGRIVGIEILDASKRVDDPRKYAEILSGGGVTIHVDPAKPAPAATA